jgi:PAS domain S-box-containing protein
MSSATASDVEGLRRELDEAQETLRAIREGEVDAFVLMKHGTYRVETLGAVDAPYRALVESMRDGAVTISADGTILYCNRPFADHVGAAPVRIIGSSIAAWLVMASELERLLSEAASGEVRCEGTLLGVGTRSPVAVTLCCLPREDDSQVFCLVVSDLSDRVAVEQLRTQQAILARQRAELDAICRYLPFAVFLAESPEDFTYVNPVAEALGRSHPEVHHHASEAAAGVLSVGDTRSEDIDMRLPTGEEATVRLYATPLDVFPSTPRALIVLQDISGERQALRARERQEQLRELFIGVLGHDLRTPLAAISTAVELLALDPSPTRAAQVARTIQRASSRMSRLIDDMLDLTLSRIGGGIPIAVAPADLKDVVDAVVQDLPAGAQERCAVQTDGETRGEWDASRLGQALGNLVGNALQYGAADTDIRVHVDGSSADTVRVSVSNRGEPIPRELLPTLFDPFRRGARAKHGSGRGLGLGLYIAERLVAAHRGRIQVDSGDSLTTFTLELPRRSRPEPAEPLSL